jgi:hypothetical protein
MQAKARILLRATVAVLGLAASVGSSAWAVNTQTKVRQLTSTLPGLVAPPVVMVKAKLLQPVAARAPAPGQLVALTRAIGRQPLSQRLLNEHFVQAANRLGDTAPEVEREARVLDRLGWRDTNATQNLLLRSALHERYPTLLDRADSLLRRGRLGNSTYQFLIAIESIPQVRGLVVARLRQHAPWRGGFFTFGNMMGTPRFQDARLATVNDLLRTGDRVERYEAAGLLGGMVGTGKAAQAYSLWNTVAKVRPAPGLFDGAFIQTAAMPPVGIPFEWQLGVGDGYSTSLSGFGSPGVDLQWDGRGIPTFLTQVARVRPAGRYILDIETDQPNDLAGLVRPVLACGNDVALFDAVGKRGNVVRFVASGGARCGFPQFMLGGRPLDYARQISVHIRRLTLTSHG